MLGTDLAVPGSQAGKLGSVAGIERRILQAGFELREIATQHRNALFEFLDILEVATPLRIGLCLRCGRGATDDRRAA